MVAVPVAVAAAADVPVWGLAAVAAVAPAQ